MKKLFFFFAILALGIIGMVVADQIDFTNGRIFSKQNTIGNGMSDPLVAGLVSPEENISSATALSPSKLQTSTPLPKKNPSIDGVRSRN